MNEFSTKRLPQRPTSVAPDGSAVRVLLRVKGGSMAHFELGPGETSQAVAHRTVEEIWFFLEGRGEIWRREGPREETVRVEAGICITIPAGTSFQFRSSGSKPLAAIAATMPPWPGDEEAYRVQGRWDPTVSGKSSAAPPD